MFLGDKVAELASPLFKSIVWLILFCLGAWLLPEFETSSDMYLFLAVPLLLVRYRSREVLKLTPVLFVPGMIGCLGDLLVLGTILLKLEVALKVSSIS